MVSYADAAWKINTSIEPITLPFVHERAFLHCSGYWIYRKLPSPHRIKRGWRRSRTDWLHVDTSGGWRSRLFGSQWAIHAVTIMMMIFVFCVLWFISCCCWPSKGRLRTNCILIPNVSVSVKKKAVGHEIWKRDTHPKEGKYHFYFPSQEYRN